MKLRNARADELEQIYRMGMDAFGEGSSERSYLAACRASPKYRQGSWQVLVEGEQLRSSAIVYLLGDHRVGIGSIATPPDLRGQGFASTLVRRLVAEVEARDADAIFFLYSDIRPAFYEKLGFTQLAPEAQRYRDSICMARGKDIARFMHDALRTPEYF